MGCSGDAQEIWIAHRAPVSCSPGQVAVPRHSRPGTVLPARTQTSLPNSSVEQSGTQAMIFEGENNARGWINCGKDSSRAVFLWGGPKGGTTPTNAPQVGQESSRTRCCPRAGSFESLGLNSAKSGLSGAPGRAARGRGERWSGFRSRPAPCGHTVRGGAATRRLQEALPRAWAWA